MAERSFVDEVKKLHDVEIGQGVEKVMGPADSGRLRVFQQGSMHSAHR